MILSIILFISVALIAMALTAGFIGCDTYAIHLDLNKFNTPYYNFGVTHHPEYSDRAEVSVLTIGLIVINIVFEFYRFSPMTDEERDEINRQIEEGNNV